MNNGQTENDQLWVKCPAGAIQKFADTAVVDRNVKAVDLQRRNLLAATATAAGVLALGGVAYLAMRQSGSNNVIPPSLGGGAMANYTYGGIDCNEVKASLSDYIAHKISDEDKVERIEKHLDMCVNCRTIYEDKLVS